MVGGGGGGLDQGTGGYRGIGQEELLLETSRRVTARYVSGWIHLILTYTIIYHKTSQFLFLLLT